MLPRLNLRRALVALISIVAMLAASVGVSYAGVSGEGGGTVILGPAGVEPDYGNYYSEWHQLPPWEHTVVIAHVTNGANEPDTLPTPTPASDKDTGLVDVYQIVASFEDYVTAKVPFVVDSVITVGPDGGGIHSPVTGNGLGFGGQDARAAEYGDIAFALSEARQSCDEGNGKYYYRNPCDVILVTYQVPADPGHRRQAMAEAMKLAAEGYQLHTVAVDSGAVSVDTGEWVSGLDADHVEFSDLLGASGYAAVTNVRSAPGVMWDIIVQRYYQKVYYEDDCWDCDEEWPVPSDMEPSYQDDCEVYDPDGNCYYGPSDDAGDNLVDISFVATYRSETNWISLVTAEDNAEIIELRYAVSDQYIDCDDASPTPEVAPERGILVDADDIGQYYCLRVEFEDGDVQFLDHQLEAQDLVWFDEEDCDDADGNCYYGTTSDPSDEMEDDV